MIKLPRFLKEYVKYLTDSLLDSEYTKNYYFPACIMADKVTNNVILGLISPNEAMKYFTNDFIQDVVDKCWEYEKQVAK